MEVTEIKYFVEAALLAAGRPLSLDQLQNLFDESSVPEKAQLREAIGELQKDYEPRGIEVSEVASGFRMQVRATMADRLSRLWEERPPRYSRALFETLALIAYRQPMTRGDIEEIRGVSVSVNIMRSLLERDWIRVVGHRDVPGRPAMFGTTRQFLDYFGLKKLDDLPPLADLADWESLRLQLNLPDVDNEEGDSADGEEASAGASVTKLPVGGQAEGAEENADAGEGPEDGTAPVEPAASTETADTGPAEAGAQADEATVSGATSVDETAEASAAASRDPAADAQAETDASDTQDASGESAGDDEAGTEDDLADDNTPSTARNA